MASSATLVSRVSVGASRPIFLLTSRRAVREARPLRSSAKR
jgi:hypothetical protein